MGTEKGAAYAMATAVPVKGGGNEFIADKCIEFIRENGDQEGKIIIKTDQESNIKCLVEDVMERRPEGRTVVELAPKGSKGSNGDVERMVGEVEGQIRALWLGFQSRMGRKLDSRERIVALIPGVCGLLSQPVASGGRRQGPIRKGQGKEANSAGGPSLGKRLSGKRDWEMSKRN